MTKTERLLLANQLRILTLLDKDGASDYALEIEALERGYEEYYAEKLSWLQDPMPQAECDEFHDIMEMFTRLEAAVAEHPDLEDTTRRRASFQGFDANRRPEASYLSYLLFLQKCDRYTSLKPGRERFNSHCPMLDSYRRQLAVWGKLKGRDLSREEVVAIANAGNRQTE